MLYEVTVVDLSGVEDGKTRTVEAESACAAILATHPRAHPAALAGGRAWTGTPRTDGSCCWDSASYPYVAARPVEK